MNTVLTLAIWASLSLLSYSESPCSNKPTLCECTLPNGVVDLSKMARNNFSVMEAEGKWTYLYQPCASFDLDDSCKDVLVCQTNPIEKESYPLASPGNFSYELINDLLTIVYMTEERTTVVTLMCEESDKDTFEFVHEKPEKTYNFQLRSAQACPGGTSTTKSTTPSTTTASTTHSSTTQNTTHSTTTASTTHSSTTKNTTHSTTTASTTHSSTTHNTTHPTTNATTHTPTTQNTTHPTTTKSTSTSTSTHSTASSSTSKSTASSSHSTNTSPGTTHSTVSTTQGADSVSSLTMLTVILVAVLSLSVS